MLLFVGLGVALLLGLLSVLPAVSASSVLTIENAVSIGEDFIRERAGISHKGFIVSEYALEFKGMVEGESNYKIIYNVNANVMGMIRDRDILVELRKSDGRVMKVSALRSYMPQYSIFL